MSKSSTKANITRQDDIKAVRRSRREAARRNDPWFGKRRSAGEMGRHKSKAAKSKNACRGKVQW